MSKINGPNQTSPGNHKASAGAGNTPGPKVGGPNQTSPGNHVNASGSMGKRGNPLVSPNDAHKSGMANSKSGQPNPAVMLGKAAIPVNPLTGSDQILAATASLRDSAKKAK